MRALLEPAHQALRASARTFLDRHVVDHLEQWDFDELVPREPWVEAGRHRQLGMVVPEKRGGAAVRDFRYRVARMEEFAKVSTTEIGKGLATPSNIVLPYFLRLVTAEQAKRWLPGLEDGTAIGAIAMTELGSGSDLQGIRVTAVRDGDGWVLNGDRTFISNDIQADLVVVLAKTDPEAGSRGFSLFVVERGTPGFERGRKLRKIGLHSQDASGLSFTDVRLPAENLLGVEGKGLAHLMERLPPERMRIAATGLAAARAALAWTVEYVTGRRAFGRRVADCQSTQVVLADVVTQVEVSEDYFDACMLKLDQEKLPVVDAAKSKLWRSEMHKRVVDQCRPLLGGYGCTKADPISRAYVDARVTTIHGGTTEIMKLIVARDVLGTADAEGA